MNDVSTRDGENGRQLVPVPGVVPALHDPYGRSLGLYGGSPADEAEESGFQLLEYLRVLIKRKWLILGIAAAFAVLSTVNALMQTPLYTSTVRLQIERDAKVVEGPQVTPQYSDWEFMQTQYQILESRQMAERVVSALRLANDADFFKPREISLLGGVMGLLRPAPNTKGSDKTTLAQWAVGIIMGYRSVRPVANSRLIDISYTDLDPNRAQRIANAYADAFVASNIDKRFQANESAKVFLDDKIKQLKLRVEESEQKLVEFAQKQQIIAVDVDQKTSVAETNLSTANTELAALTSERTKNEELWRQADKADSINVPQLLSDEAMKTLLAKRAELNIEYQQKLKTFKPLYPGMVELRAKLDEIDRQIAYQLEVLKDSLKAAYETSLAREKEVKGRVEGLKAELLELQKGSIKFNMVKREVDTNRELYTSLLQRYKEVDVASGVGANTVFVVDKANPGSLPSNSLIMTILKALLLGLAAGFAAAFALEYFDDKIRTPEQVEQFTGLPLLGVIPKVDEISRQLADVKSPLSEAHRSLCTALQFTTESGMPKTVALTSAGPAEGKSVTAMAIARHFATLGRKVLLVDADLRNPSQHLKLGCDNLVGLSNYLTGTCTPPEVMQKTEIPTLAFIASGPLPPNAADLLGSSRLVSLISIGSEIFDLIVIDGPPVMAIADAQLLSTAASATLFVVGAGAAKKRFVRGAIKRLRLSRANILGAVLAQYNAKAAGYGYGYGSDYGYGYGYGAGAEPRGLSVRLSPKQQPQLTDAHESA